MYTASQDLIGFGLGCVNFSKLVFLAINCLKLAFTCSPSRYHGCHHSLLIKQSGNEDRMKFSLHLLGKIQWLGYIRAVPQNPHRHCKYRLV